ncbi:Agamous-like MADS-box protein FUL-L [Linum perenne]
MFRTRENDGPRTQQWLLVVNRAIAQQQHLMLKTMVYQSKWSICTYELFKEIQAYRFEVLQRNLRNLVGEEIDPMSLRELQQLEQQIDTALKKVRSRKERSLSEQNGVLTKKVKQNEKEVSTGNVNEQQTMLHLHPLTIGNAFQQHRGPMMSENENEGEGGVVQVQRQEEPPATTTTTHFQMKLDEIQVPSV